MNDRQAGNRLTRQTRSLVYLFILSKEKKKHFSRYSFIRNKAIKRSRGYTQRLFSVIWFCAKECTDI